MKMGGQLIQSRAAIYDGIGNEELYLYSDAIVSLHWEDYLIDTRVFETDEYYRERVVLKCSGVYSLGYSVSSQLEWSNQRDNVRMLAYLNGVPLLKTVSYSYMRNEATGAATNSFNGNITVTEPNSILEIKIQRNNGYRGIVRLRPPECSLNLKRERPL
tara:strand:+ start:401 stop:877 length:477 start_codon:yes stop_codon:yes gene_type:complete